MVQLGFWRLMDKECVSPPPTIIPHSVLIAVGSLWPYIYLMHSLVLVHTWVKMIPLHTLPAFPFPFLFSFRTLYCYPPKKYLKTRHPGKPTMHESHIFKDPSHLMGWSSGSDSRPSRRVSVRWIPGWNPCTYINWYWSQKNRPFWCDLSQNITLLPASA
jgi:hypothetical protein